MGRGGRNEIKGGLHKRVVVGGGGGGGGSKSKRWEDWGKRG